MNIWMLYVGAHIVGTVLSAAILLRVLYLSVGLWSERSSLDTADRRKQRIEIIPNQPDI
jgi:hypothetical protein